jgi:succinoglycan biosynthesis protein ExoV
VKLFYYHDPLGNFGDDLNAWLWPRLIPELLDGQEPLLVGIGSILDRRIPQEPQKVVFGTGVGYGLLPVLDETWQICCVRGPLTAKALGLPHGLAVTDPAVLMSTLRAAATARTHGVSFIPHFRTPAHAAALGIDLERICAEVGIHYINPCGPVEDVLDAIERSSKVVAEAMHGAIVADALRVPWVPVQLSDRILRLKWHDWCGSLGMRYVPLCHVPDPRISLEASISRFLIEAARHAQPTLSDDHSLKSAIEELTGRLETLKVGARGGGIQGSPQFKPDPEVLREVPWLYDMQMALKELDEVILPGATFILVDEERWGGEQVLAGRRTLPFTEHEGRYWGLPPDSKTAVSELERLREAGAQYIVFMQPSFWWLDFYTGLSDHLRQYRTVAESRRIMAFELSQI